MPASPIRSSNLGGGGPVDSSTVSTAVINGVAAGNALIAVVCAHRAGTGSGNLIDGYGSTIGGSAANTWTLVGRAAIADPGNFRTEITYWIAHNVSAGNTTCKPDFTYEDGSTNCQHHVDEWPGMPTLSAPDRFAAAGVPTNTGSISVGPTAALAQAAEVVYAAFCNRYTYEWGGGSSGAGTPPSGYTLLKGETSNVMLPFQTSYREVSATTAISVSISQVVQSDQGGVGAIATFKLSTTNFRVEITGINTDVNAATGLSAYVWTANPKDATATEYLNVTAEATGGTIYLTPAPVGTTDNQSVNCAVYQTSGTKGLVGIVPGTVKEY